MKAMLIVLLVAMMNTGCQTPAGVRDTAAITSRLAIQLNGHMAQFADASNSARKQDAQRLSIIIEQAQEQLAIADVQFQAANASHDERFRKLVPLLRSAEPSETIVLADEHAERLTTKFGTNTYDPAPLAAIATTAGTLAEPVDRKAQAIAIASFFKEVSDQLKGANEKTATSAAAKPPASQ